MVDKFKKIVVLDGRMTNPMGYDFESMLGEVADEVRIYQTTEPHQIKRRCKGADAIVVGQSKIESQTLNCLAEDLKVIIAASTGYDYLNGCLDTAQQLGIHVCNVPDYCSDAVARYVFTSLDQALTSTSDLKYGWRKAGQEILTAVALPLRITNLTLGIVGLGRIGTKVARMANVAHGMSNVVAYSPHWRDKELPEDVHVQFMDSLEDVAVRSDVLTVHCKLNSQTDGLISSRIIKRMKKGAILINTARQEIVDEEALVHALLTNDLRAAVVDVTGENSKLKNVRNAIVTDHMAYADDVSLKQLLSGVLGNARSYLSADPINSVFQVSTSLDIKKARGGDYGKSLQPSLPAAMRGLNLGGALQQFASV
ncbi:MAG: NAD(P)-dependent oxidoreductase [Bdellovibrionales bacterium]